MQQDPRRNDTGKQGLSMTYGLVFGAALGLLLSVVFDFNLAYGLVIGTAAGMLIGLFVDHRRI
ncbi:MAG: hypothetical protein M9890_15145 [Thermomicrobiales bacterium]|nr:hypothetical protein [Thermomicrobiales bacterium]